jgi:hypothetical protein
MANEREIQEIKESLQKVEQRVAELSADKKRGRSGLTSFAIGFLIVLVVMLIGIGVIQFMNH